MTRILGLGDNTIDTYVDVGVQYPGGNAVNVAVLTARLGAECGYLGCVGNDEGGALLRAALEAEGLDLTRLRVREGATGRAYIGHVAGDRQFLRTAPGVRGDYRWTDDDFDYVATFDQVHTSIYSELGDTLPRIARSARSLSLDASNRWTPRYLKEALPHVGIAFLSASELDDAAADRLIDTCLALGPSRVVLTRGSAGAIGATPHERRRQPALPTELVDTLGAGDGFISGFLVATLDGASLEQALLAGAEFAARVCSWQGGFGHAAPWTGDRASIPAAA